MIPELVGRLPVVTPLNQLSREALMSILTEPRNALVKQYAKLLEFEDVELEVQEEALEAVVDRALKLSTGARGLRTVLEAVMGDLMFELPEMAEARKVVITRSVVEGLEPPKVIKDSAARKSA